jgi:hypothetical protein
MTTVYGGAMVPRWRQQLVEWMGEVVREFHLSDATFFAAVQLLDRLLSAKRIKSEELQAFALVACIVCAKVHDSKFIRMVSGVCVRDRPLFCVWALCCVEGRVH